MRTAQDFEQHRAGVETLCGRLAGSYNRDGQLCDADLDELVSMGMELALDVFLRRRRDGVYCWQPHVLDSLENYCAKNIAAVMVAYLRNRGFVAEVPLKTFERLKAARSNDAAKARRLENELAVIRRGSEESALHVAQIHDDDDPRPELLRARIGELAAQHLGVRLLLDIHTAPNPRRAIDAVNKVHGLQRGAGKRLREEGEQVIRSDAELGAILRGDLDPDPEVPACPKRATGEHSPLATNPGDDMGRRESNASTGVSAGASPVSPSPIPFESPEPAGRGAAGSATRHVESRTARPDTEPSIPARFDRQPGVELPVAEVSLPCRPEGAPGVAQGTDILGSPLVARVQPSAAQTRVLETKVPAFFRWPRRSACLAHLRVALRGTQAGNRNRHLCCGVDQWLVSRLITCRRRVRSAPPLPPASARASPFLRAHPTP